MRSVRGDVVQMALAGRFDVLVHGCNCQHKMKSGVAGTIAMTFPEAVRADLATRNAAASKLGSISVAEIQRSRLSFKVVNAYSQFDWRGDGVKVDYEALRSAFAAVKARFHGARIGYPLIGAGLAGGDWTKIQPIIDEALDGEDHMLVEFDGRPAKGDDRPRYAGIGARATPPAMAGYMRRVAERLANRGLVLRSGAASGADAAFEAGCLSAGGGSEIWLPERRFNDHPDTGLYPHDRHHEIAATLHPVWRSLTPKIRALHARNVGQVLGYDAATPVKFVLCWTEDGCESEASSSRGTGGTRTAIVLADRHGIPVINLARPDARQRLAELVLSIPVAALPFERDPVLDGERCGGETPGVHSNGFSGAG